MTNEEFYDAEVAPVLADLAKRCSDRGMSLLVAAEYEPGSYGSTGALVPGAGYGMRLIHAAIQANGNVDGLMLAVMRHAQAHGHESLILKRLDVPVEPAGSERPAPAVVS